MKNKKKWICRTSERTKPLRSTCKVLSLFQHHRSRMKSKSLFMPHTLFECISFMVCNESSCVSVGNSLSRPHTLKDINLCLLMRTVSKSFEHADAVSYLLISDQTDKLFLPFSHLLPQLCEHFSNNNNNCDIINTDTSEARTAKQQGLCLVS